MYGRRREYLNPLFNNHPYFMVEIHNFLSIYVEDASDKKGVNLGAKVVRSFRGPF
jgi:hypothetical protein